MIQRDITCWYCQRDQHAKCFSRLLCVCYACRIAPRPQQTTWNYHCACSTPCKKWPSCQSQINPITAALRPH